MGILADTILLYFLSGFGIIKYQVCKHIFGVNIHTDYKTSTYVCVQTSWL